MSRVKPVTRSTETKNAQPSFGQSPAVSVVQWGCPKIGQNHHERIAIVYVRQSSPHQVFEHRESRARQYALADFAVVLGWSKERVLVIDEDQGQSGQSAEHRSGFQRLLMEVTLNHVGIILGLEMSRLARSSKDWHHLLELCSVFGTLLADQEGVYDPRDPNDRLVLGLKGTMSELEIHTMRNRLEKGKLHKAQRGALFFDVPTGYIKTSSGEIAFDPDVQVRTSVELIFEKFDELGSIWSLYRYLVDHGIRLGARLRHGPKQGELEWRYPSLSTLAVMLHHPFYCGTYAYGRSKVDHKRRHSGRPARERIPMEQWQVVLNDRVPAYITREQFHRIQERLRQNRSLPDTAGLPRHGEALMSGILFCKGCGTRLIPRYSSKQPPRYQCRHIWIQGVERESHGVTVEAIDGFVVQKILQALEPASLELSLLAARDIQREHDRHVLHWQQQLERATYECSKAERHYRAVDPENRLVARSLEQQWELSLRKAQELREDYDRFLLQMQRPVTADDKIQVLALSQDIPALWSFPSTTAIDRKEVIRCLIDRVEVDFGNNSEHMNLTVHWKGGVTSQHPLIRPVKSYGMLRDYDHLVERARQLRTEGQSAAQIAEHLNEEGFHPVRGKVKFEAKMVRQLLPRLGLSGALEDVGTLRPNEWRLSDLANKLKIHPSKLRRWATRGWILTRRPRALWTYIAFADARELSRLRRLRDYIIEHYNKPVPAELTMPLQRDSEASIRRNQEITANTPK